MPHNTFQLTAGPKTSAGTRVVRRRSFLQKFGVATATLPAVALLGETDDNKLTKGDVAILRLLAATEIIETDLWVQYSELGGTQDNEISGVHGGNPLYTAALGILDGDMPQYIHDNTDDEKSHASFLNRYLASKAAGSVDLTPFRRLQGTRLRGLTEMQDG